MAGGQELTIHSLNQRIFETSVDLIMVVDRQGNMARLSPSAHTILGYQPHEMVGHSAADFIHPDDLEPTREEMRRARRANSTRRFPCRYAHKDGRIINLIWTGVWSEPEQQHFFIGRDTTEADAAALQMREDRAARDLAVSANLAKSRFLATASHDLRQPLHAMNLFISALRRRVTGGEATRLVEGMAAATASMQAMFNAVLDVSKLEAGAVTPAITDFALASLLDSLRASFAGPAAAKELNLHMPATDAMVRSDPVLLESILRNLLSNAVRYTASGEVSLECETLADSVRIEVTDTGPGIPPDAQERIFEEFQRLNNQNTTERGLGLGLAIVRGLATLLDMDVELTSEVGIGSVFTVTVPRATAPANLAVAEGHQSKPLTGRRLLLVEDDTMILDGLAREVADWGALSIVARSAEEAMSLLMRPGQALPELAIVDRDLGGRVDGPALLGLLRERLGLSIPAIIVTGATDPEAINALRESGYPWITKPIDAAVLQRTAGELLGQ